MSESKKIMKYRHIKSPLFQLIHRVWLKYDSNMIRFFVYIHKEQNYHC